MRLLRTSLLPVLAVGVAIAVSAPAAAQDRPFTGKSKNRYGTVTLKFTTVYVENQMTLRVSRKLARKSRGKTFDVQCRVEGRYQAVASVMPLSNGQRRLSAPAEAPLAADRCRVKKRGKVVATMRMHG